MFILPSKSQGSTASSSSTSLPSSSNLDGHRLPLRPSPPSSLSSQSPPSPSTASALNAIRSLQISESKSSIGMSALHQVSGPSAPAAEDSGGSSEEVTVSGTSHDLTTLASQQNVEVNSESNLTVREVGSFQSRGKASPTAGFPRKQKLLVTEPSQFHQRTQSAGRKTQMVSGNHLLNFHYRPISRPQPRVPPPPPRKQLKKKPYNKDLFLQANYKFVMLDSGNYSAESMDPDKILQWEDIICLRYSAPFMVQCPICLECPLCPQITSCGHIFCFPCILQYLLMGEDDHKGDSWKRCPLCFVMISPKDLYTLYIENVNRYSVGDTIEFLLLTRQKDSFTITHKEKKEELVTCPATNFHDPFSKFIFTSDVELSVRKAISDLDGWLVKADSGLVDDLEKLPYVCAALQQLEKRKKYWNEQRAHDSVKSSMSAVCCDGCNMPPRTVDSSYKKQESEQNISSDNLNQSNGSHDIVSEKSDEGVSSNQKVDIEEISEGETKNLSFCANLGGPKDVKNESFRFYQAADGQHAILHPINMRCLVHHYGSYDSLPDRISGRVLQLETITQSEAIRKRYRFLSHFSLTTMFQLCEIDLNGILPPNALAPFLNDIKKREKQRKQVAEKELKETIRAEAATEYAVPILQIPGYSHSFYDDPPNFSMDDFEALGNPVASTSPPVFGQSMLFSNVTRLGFAAAHDSPSLRSQEISPIQNQNTETDSSGGSGPRNTESRSFANVISREKSHGGLDTPNPKELGRKGKKQSRVLLSTSGGRRY